MNPFRLALLAGLLLVVPGGSWLLSALGTQPALPDLHRAAMLLTLFQTAIVLVLLPALAADGPPLAPALLAFLVPAPLAVLLVLAGANAGLVVGAQLLGLLTVICIALPWRRLARVRAASPRLDGQHLVQTALLLGLGLLGSRLLAMVNP